MAVVVDLFTGWWFSWNMTGWFFQLRIIIPIHEVILFQRGRLNQFRSEFWKFWLRREQELEVQLLRSSYCTWLHAGSGWRQQIAADDRCGSGPVFVCLCIFIPLMIHLCICWIYHLIRMFMCGFASNKFKSLGRSKITTHHGRLKTEGCLMPGDQSEYPSTPPSNHTCLLWM